ncbi:MAG: EpsI family protein [Parvularculaceae bacterium]|nr:EpsI family protein [Parvularculaceae bacterium]
MRVAEARLAAGPRTLFVAALMLAVAAGVASVKPRAPGHVAAPDLEALLPEAFGEWRAAPIPDAVLPKELDLTPGEAVAYRAYRDSAGRLVTLVVAYGPPLGDSVRLHRPESCYVAQGYEILERTIEALSLGGTRAEIVRLAASSPTRDETVSYWMRSGSDFVTHPAAAQFQAFRGLSHPDGALVRASSPGQDGALFDIQARFLAEFAAALGPEARRVLLGSREGAAS